MSLFKHQTGSSQGLRSEDTLVMRKWKSRLAVSTVIANMLMILITLSLAAILVAWAGTSYGAFTGGTQVFFVQRGQALQERVVIEYVYFITSSPTKIQVFVRNVGVEQVQIATIYVNGNPFPVTSSSLGVKTPCSIVSSAVLLTVGSSSSTPVCEFDITTNWTSGSTVYVVAASLRGNQATFTAWGP
jgi:FlaG/FlaF family flagellin (archaellin)